MCRYPLSHQGLDVGDVDVSSLWERGSRLLSTDMVLGLLGLL
jgi:hypothetical protein